MENSERYEVRSAGETIDISAGNNNDTLAAANLKSRYERDFAAVVYVLSLESCEALRSVNTRYVQARTAHVAPTKLRPMSAENSCSRDYLREFTCARTGCNTYSLTSGLRLLTMISS